jgi:hypothetical protein
MLEGRLISITMLFVFLIGNTDLMNLMGKSIQENL